jgi:superoxide dismutase, Fe-Mn family
VKPLGYKFSDLEPYIDNATMFLHHQIHHQTYVTNLNSALKNSSDVSKTILDLQANATLRGPVIRNNAGGHYNHELFWSILSPPLLAMQTKPSSQLSTLLKSSFGSQSNMMVAFNRLAAPASTFGSGWVWLCVNAAGNKLLLVKTSNQDNPLMSGISTETMYPILGLDVWEHAYFLKYNFSREAYVANFWKVVNWTKVSNFAAYAITNKKGMNV